MTFLTKKNMVSIPILSNQCAFDRVDKINNWHKNIIYKRSMLNEPQCITHLGTSTL